MKRLVSTACLATPAQPGPTARFVTLPAVFTSTQARTYATVGVRLELKLR